jgi:hypothetical protein
MDMHSSDRTLIARLGFADPDKGDIRHDLACQYVASDGNARKLLARVIDPKYYYHIRQNLESLKFRGQSFLNMEKCIFGPVTMEMPISKGEAQYKTTIGFVDVRIGYNLTVTREGEQNLNAAWLNMEPEWEPVRDDISIEGNIFVEVKIRPVGLGEILRQINLYREFIDKRYDSSWVLATVYMPSASAVWSLREAGVTHVFLGRDFEIFERACQETDQEAGSKDCDDCGSFTL